MAASARYKCQQYRCQQQLVLRSQQGFTLLEILVAFVVMALVVGTLLQLFGTQLRSLALANEYSGAVQVAESQLRTVGTLIPVEPGLTSGQVSGTPYQWRVLIEEVEVIADQQAFSLSVQPFKTVVEVFWESGGRQRQYSLSSLRFGEAL